METLSLSAPLFTSQHTPVSTENPTFKSSCSLNPSTSSSHFIKLIDNTLVLEHSSQPALSLSITFDTKFQVLYEISKNIQSAKKGIRFYDQDQRELSMFMDTQTTQLWIDVLKKRMNQKGFHEMFKPSRKLGKGNFATVYEAERLSDHAKFAVKAFIKQNCFASKNGKDSLINQLTVLRQLNKQPHANILKLEGVYESDNSIYVVLQLLTGKTLHHAIQERRGFFSPKEVKFLISGILKGLTHMHKNRIMHRDLKPQNIMLREGTFEPVIVDFGLATNADLSQYLFFRCGTPGYVAPEILTLTHSQHIEPVCDIFSLGSLFHLLLSSQPLFAGAKYDEVYKNNKQLNMNLSGAHLDDISNQTRELLKKMLDLQPKSRISAEGALSHAYFSEQEAEEMVDLKLTSPVLTDYREGEIKRMGLLFY